MDAYTYIYSTHYYFNDIDRQCLSESRHTLKKTVRNERDLLASSTFRSCILVFIFIIFSFAFTIWPSSLVIRVCLLSDT